MTRAALPLVPTLWLEHALLPGGWARGVRIDIAGGMIAAVTPDASPEAGGRKFGIAVPGIPNVHSHAFQRGMAGLTEIRGPGADSFWTWREVMYRFLAGLGPPSLQAISAYAYMRMLEAGYTSVGEFHYLHHDQEGRPYSDPAEMSARIARAAGDTGITLTLLPCFYRQGGFDAAPPTPGQRRFITDPESFLRLLEAARGHLAGLPGARLGIAPHSLRAVTPADLRIVLAAVPTGPVHIHAAEQTLEVAEAEAVLGAPPVAWLLGEAGVDARWCLIHATHMRDDETVALARSGAVAGLCPLTEADLGDGIFPTARFVEAGGRFAIGSDSNVITDPAAELRQLETAQRLALRSRNVLPPHLAPRRGRRCSPVRWPVGRRRWISRLAQSRSVGAPTSSCWIPSIPIWPSARAMRGWTRGCSRRRGGWCAT
ncbi:MAG: formimidoylglutamate deiminase [Acetobacteraceae bacterium]